MYIYLRLSIQDQIVFILSDYYICIHKQIYDKPAAIHIELYTCTMLRMFATQFENK